MSGAGCHAASLARAGPADPQTPEDPRQKRRCAARRHLVWRLSSQFTMAAHHPASAETDKAAREERGQRGFVNARE